MECSDVGIDPKIEEELENTVAFGLEKGEQEDTSEYSIKVILNFKLNLKRHRRLNSAFLFSSFYL